jgi:cathepsin B
MNSITRLLALFLFPLSTANPVYDTLFSQHRDLDLTPEEKSWHQAEFAKSNTRGDTTTDLDNVHLFLNSVPALTEHISHTVQSSTKLWKSTHKEGIFVGKTVGYAKTKLGYLTRTQVGGGHHPRGLVATTTTTTAKPKFVAPVSFDSRTAFPKCSALIGTARNQCNCGSCWAFATTESFNDRLCIDSKGTFQTKLSPNDVMSCANAAHGLIDYGCQGGYLLDAWKYFVKYGVVSGGTHADAGTGKSCWPYFVGSDDDTDNLQAPACSTTCPDRKYPTKFATDKHFAKSAYEIPSTVAAIQQEVMAHGPIAVGFTVYADFLSYSSGVYHHVTGSVLGGHAVKLIGWGSASGVKYWILVNSWGKSWGEQGTFRMKMGDCGIESDPVAGLTSLR